MRKLLALGGMLVVLALAVTPNLYAQATVACFTYSCSGLTCTFSASCSQGAQGRYGWNFGDGSPVSSSSAPTHTYANPGTYKVILKVGVIPNNVDVTSQNVTVP